MMDVAVEIYIVLFCVTCCALFDRVIKTGGRAIATPYACTLLMPNILSTFPWDALSVAFPTDC